MFSGSKYQIRIQFDKFDEYFAQVNFSLVQTHILPFYKSFLNKKMSKKFRVRNINSFQCNIILRYL